MAPRFGASRLPSAQTGGAAAVSAGGHAAARRQGRPDT